ncbi:hypothetical protein FDECE_12358 [Fusarium decemcellulare]|nr:hypothetical protein FDECE_12358 [Fusarium decemcellulare]
MTAPGLCRLNSLQRQDGDELILPQADGICHHDMIRRTRAEEACSGYALSSRQLVKPYAAQKSRIQDVLANFYAKGPPTGQYQGILKPKKAFRAGGLAPGESAMGMGPHTT